MRFERHRADRQTYNNGMSNVRRLENKTPYYTNAVK